MRIHESGTLPPEVASEPSLARRWRSTVVGYGLPLVAFVGAVVAAFLVEKDQDHSPAAFGVTAAVALVALLTAVSQYFRDMENSRQSARLAKLTEENARLVRTLKGEITGGESFAMAYFPVKDGKRWLALRHYGEETLRDVRVELMGFDPPRVLDGVVYPSLLPRTVELVKPLEFQGNSFGLQVSFSAPNGWWAEAVKAMRVDGELVFALQAWRIAPETSSRVILHQDVHPKFPLPVDWSLAKPVDLSTLVRVTESSEDTVLRGLGMR